MRIATGLMAGFCVLGPACYRAVADVSSMSTARDNSIQSDNSDRSNGSGPNVFAGRTGSHGLRRALLGFDILSGVPQDSTVTSAVLRLYMNRTVFGAADFTLHKVTSDWGEAGSSNPLGEGAPAQPGDATWTYTFFNTGTWATAGGDFLVSTSALRSVNGNGFYSWESAGMIVDIQDWVTSPTNCYGWILVGDESQIFTAKRFDSRESTTASRRPGLTVGFIPPPDLEISKFGSVSPVIAGSNLTYTVTVSNRGPLTATGVTITEYLSDDLSLLSGNAVSNVGPLVVGATTTLTYRVGVAASALNTVSNFSVVTSDTVDPIPTNDRASVVTPVATICDLSIRKQAAGPGIIGQTAVQVLSISNAGLSDAQNTHILDTLPECVLFVSASASGGCVFSNGVVDCSVGTAAAGEVVTAIVRVEYLLDGTYTNSASVVSDTTDILPQNNATQAVTEVAAGSLFYAAGTTYGPLNLGDGRDGDLTVTNAWSVDALRSTLVSNATAGSSEITLADGNGFSVGDEVFLRVAQGTSSNVGCYTFAFVEAIQQNMLKLSSSLAQSYDVSNSVVSVQRVPHYASVTILSNGVLTASSWNGTNGGVVVFRVAGELDVQAGGAISADGIGYRGGGAIVATNETSHRSEFSGWQGESFAGIGLQDDTNANFGGGGAGLAEVPDGFGTDSGTGGGGGGHADPGINGEDKLAESIDDGGGRGGSTYGNAGLTKILPGSGGGSGGHDKDLFLSDQSATSSGKGGNGGGIVLLAAKSVVLNGSVSARGEDGGDAAGICSGSCADELGGGGGGSGGSVLVLFVSSNTTVSASAAGGSGGRGGRIDNVSLENRGGDAGDGRVVVAQGREADLGIMKQISPGPYLLGEDLLYTITVTNAGPDDAAGVIVADFLPEGVAFLSVTSEVSECFVSNRVVRCNTGTNAIIAGGSAAIEILVRLTSVTILTNKVILASTTTLDPAESNNIATAETLVQPAANLRLVKTASSESVVAGSNLVYTISVSNIGPSEASQVVIADVLPADVTLVSGSTNNPIGNLSAGNSTSLLITVSVDPGALGAMTNVAVATSDTSDPVPGNNQDEVDTTVLAVADLSVVKAASASPVLAGSNMVYFITVSNAGPSDARNVVAIDSLPAGLLPPGPVTNALGTLVPGAAQLVQVPVQILSDASGPITNVVTIASDTADPGTSNNTAKVVTDVLARADLHVTKSEAFGSVLAGSNVVYTVTVSNRGPSQAENVIITDQLPGGIDLLAGETNLVAGNMEPGATTSLVIVAGVDSDALGIITNTAGVTSDTTDPNAGNNVATAETDIEAFAKLIIWKQASVSSVIAGSNMVYTITVSNAGPSVAREVSVVDELPAELSPSGLTSNALGDLDTGDVSSFDIAVDVHGAASGQITNTATVSSTTDGPPGTNASTEVTGIIRLADLDLEKSASAGPVIPGSNLLYTVSVTNRGPGQAENVVIVDALPEDVNLLAGPTNVIVGSLAAGGSTSLVLLVAVPETTLVALTNMASVSSTTTDPVPSNNIDVEVTGMFPIADLHIFKSPSTNVAIAGDPLTYSLSVSNAGPSFARNVTVTDFLPPGVTPSEVIVTNLGAIATGSTAAFSLDVVVHADLFTGSVLTNSATVSGDAHDTTSGNNLTTELTDVLSRADLGASKHDTVDPVEVSGFTEYIITMTNAGPSRAWDVVLTDTLPPGITPSGPVVTNVGFIPPGGWTSIVIAVHVHTNTTGTITNRAEVSTTSMDTNAADNVAFEETTIPDFDGDGHADFSDDDDDNDSIPDAYENQHGLDPKDDQDADDDPDMDMFSNLEEYIADTDPTNELSFFSIQALVATNSMLIFFDSSTGRIYTLEFNDDLANGFFTNAPEHTDIPGQGGADVFLDTNDVLQRFYRIEVELP